MASGVYLHHRYGTHEGMSRIRVGRGGMAARPTRQVMLDKCRYNETRFKGESNALYVEGGEQLPDYRAAYTYTEQAATLVAAGHKHGRSAGKSYVYDTTINAGDGRVSRESMHDVVSAYRAELEKHGHRVEGMQYAIHDNGSHTHAHVMYATQRTIQRAEDRSLKTVMRDHTDRARERDQAVTVMAEMARADLERGPQQNEHEWGR